ncbi:MAG TPA: acyl-CoA dehydratase activase [Chitinivibrionales bacterium]|nr:acyl-CoA dehydratase activase [Chitinivibrionales bacterium]
MKSLGICFGATTVQYAVVKGDAEFKIIEQSGRIAHEGNPGQILQNLLSGLNLFEIDAVAVTGRSFRNNVALTGVSEPEALETALFEDFKNKEFPNLVVSLGGETTLVYKIGERGGIVSLHSGNKCASGTGEFFLQQIRRMGLSLDNAVELAGQGMPHKIAGRCSVFCKSDCTHALNKGEPIANIAAGLCSMVADKIADLIKDMECDRVMLVGGGALNTAVVSILSKRFSSLQVPETAAFYEAYGAALWAMINRCRKVPGDIRKLVLGARASFGHHTPLSKGHHLVTFEKDSRAGFDPEAEYIIGLDVGSTTTKAVLMRRDKKITASVYLRTNGNPVEASRKCYAAIRERIGRKKARIVALGVTGSGRQIAGLHALTDNVINEIIAHATAAAHFDKDVDTIFEIGGQDAKYTFLTGGVPSDYAMNEACSAGTGSFLEESALESLNVKMEDIGDRALAAGNPPNFTDQCAAFISSDIKLAGQDGIDKNNILAGLVYSICLNYLNRVKGSRPVGKKIFMQGGVCYNRAVPVAMASLLKMPIIVPPEPGLMGALGVALEVNNRLSLGFSAPQAFDLEDLANREAVKEGTFTCAGGREKCDRKCEIAKIRINGTVHSFGGICNKYYNLRIKKKVETGSLDFVAIREKLLFETYGAPAGAFNNGRTVGLCRSFLTHTLYPLYSHFFSEMGFTVVLSDEIDPKGISRIESGFCLPGEIAHGSFYNLLQKNLDYIFLPHITQLHVRNVPTYSRLCIFVQGESYYLKTTFRKELEASPTIILSPVIAMKKGYRQAQKTLAAMAVEMGIAEPVAREAYAKACGVQLAFDKKLLEAGREALSWLDSHPETFGVVLFGRPYNSFTNDANMGIPHKIASRGHLLIPHDMLPSDEYEVDSQMFWAMGQKIMKSAQMVKEHARLFGFYITNFSCGPDSFLLTYFRNLMGRKPSLTLELDQHTADAGIDTRVEAALDIMKSYCRTATGGRRRGDTVLLPTWVDFQGKVPVVHASDGRVRSIYHSDVEVVLPSMGRYATEGVAAVMRSIGIAAKALPISDKEVLLEGRKNTSCKECLPYIVTTGSFMHYCKTQRPSDKISLFFMASGGGPCRLGQYCTAMDQLFHTNGVKNAAAFPMTNENGYAGLGGRALLSASQAIMAADVFCEIRSFLAVAARDRDFAQKILEECWQELVRYFEGKLSIRFSILLSLISRKLKQIPLAMNMGDVPVVSLIGEIFVRQDEFSRKNLIDYLERRGFMVKVAPVSEYLAYSNYIVNQGFGEKEFPLKELMKLRVITGVQEWWERRIKTVLAKSGCYKFEMIEVDKTMASAGHLMNEHFRGECILTVGLGLREILHDSCGVVSIGPFGCMPSRVAEAVLKKEMNVKGKLRMNTTFRGKALLEDLSEFPFLAVETDGSPFPQLIEANLEAFVVQARRVYDKMKSHHQGSREKMAIKSFIKA